MEASIIILDEINCTLVDFEPKILQYFNKKFEYDVPSARFSPKFALGIWDGTISYFSNIGETYVNMLPEIIPDLVRIGTPFKVTDNRATKTDIILPTIDANLFAHITHPVTNKPFTLRNYQVEAINIMCKNMGEILVSSTGSGKTNITAAICKIFNDQNLRSIVIVPNVSLVSQTYESLLVSEIDVGRLGGGHKDINHKTVVSTWQTLNNVKPMLKDFQMALVDECHTGKAQVIQSIFKEAGNHIKYRFGLTGTMPKDDIDIRSINNILGYVQHTISARTLIDAGYLSDLKIDVQQLSETFHKQYNNFQKANPNSKMKYSGFKSAYFPDYNAEKTFLRNNEERLSYLANTLISRSDLGNVFALVDNIQFGKKLLKIIKSNSNREHVYFVSGKDSVDDRQKIYDLFKTHDNILVIATVQCAGVGTDISRIYQLFLIDLGKSFIRTIQAIGRGLRKAEDKEFIDVVDISSDLKYSKKHVNERLKFYKEAGYPYKKNKINYIVD